MLCGICNINPSKYKCPKCSVPYCSLTCFKGEKHVDLDNNLVKHQPATGGTLLGTEEKLVSEENASEPVIDRFERVLQDEQIRTMLKIKSLQFHLSTILKILSDLQLTNEPTVDGRREIANKKLCNLRAGGVEENEVIEDFVLRVLVLMS